MADHPPPRQNLPPGRMIARHRHEDAYVAVVLAGGYEEAGETGRRRLQPGEVAVHEPFAGHRNGVGRTGASVLNLPAAGLPTGFGRVADPDALARMAELSLNEAANLLRAAFIPLPAQRLDWPDELAIALAADPRLVLSDWAKSRGLATETLSRGFGRVFGLSPKRFRYEARARRALRGLANCALPLAHLALDLGFADQAHMCHAVSDLTGRPPGRWRTTSSGDKTGA